MGTDYSQNNAYVTSLRECARVIFKAMDKESYERVKQSCAVWMESNKEYVENLEHWKSILSPCVYEDDRVEIANGSIPSLLKWALDLYSEMRKVVDDDGEIGREYWGLLVSNCGRPEFAPYAEAHVYFFSDSTYTKRLEGVDWEEPYLELCFPLYEQILTTEAKQFAELFGEDNLPSECSWVSVSS